MSDIDEIQASVRLNNLELVLCAFSQQKELAALLEVEPSYLSRIKNRNVKFSRGKAAEIESALGLPYKWMEQKNVTLPALRFGSEGCFPKQNESSHEEQILLSSYRGLPDNFRKAVYVIVTNISTQKKGAA